MEVRFGLRPGDLRGPNFKAVAVKEQACLAMGRLATPAAVTYWRGLKQENFTKGELHRLWPAAQIGLHAALVARISGRQEKIAFLEGLLTAQRDPVSDSHVDYWALDQLCDSGSLVSLSVVQRRLEEGYSSNPHVLDKELRFCEQRIRVMMTDPDPVIALHSLLTVSSDPPDRRLLYWAVERLEEMESPRADEVLARFAEKIAALPETSAHKPFFRSLRWEISGRLHSKGLQKKLR